MIHFFSLKFEKNRGSEGVSKYELGRKEREEKKSHEIVQQTITFLFICLSRLPYRIGHPFIKHKQNVEGCRDGSGKNHRNRCRDGSTYAGKTGHTHK